MAVNTVVIPADRETVFAVLEDPYAYPKWVVGPRRVVRADRDFPDPGSAFTHEEKVGPVEAQDETEVMDIDAPSHVRLTAKLRPFGAIASIGIDLEAVDGGTKVTMTEEPTSGPVAAVWNPLFDRALWLRNVLALRRLRDLVLHPLP